MVGVFSTRSPDRPNPVGIHKVKVLSISQDGIIGVSGLEVLDQTPLIDIKPVLN
jgi:tRNA (Thr-GGU) A37 N-methylase